KKGRSSLLASCTYTNLTPSGWPILVLLLESGALPRGLSWKKLPLLTSPQLQTKYLKLARSFLLLHGWPAGTDSEIPEAGTELQSTARVARGVGWEVRWPTLGWEEVAAPIPTYARLAIL
ncbi:unnamed protein product, partial [Pylaiella littoralis]